MSHAIGTNRCSPAQERLTGNKALFSGSPVRKHMLTGLLRCPVCGKSMIGQKRERVYAHSTKLVHHYHCPNSSWSRNAAGVVCSPKMFEADRAQRPDFPAETITPAALAAPRRNAPEYLLHCLETGSPIEGFCSPQVGRDTQEIPEAGLRSADTGRTQTLPL